MLSLRGGTFYSNITDQLVQPTEPRWRHLGTGNSIYPDIPNEYIRPRGWQNMPYWALWVREKVMAQRSYINSDFTYYLDLAGEHVLKLGIQWVRTNEDSNDVFKYPESPSLMGPTPDLVWTEPWHGKVRLLQGVRQ